MSKPLPELALSLSVNGISLHQQTFDGRWKELARVSLSDPNIGAKMAAMRRLAVKLGDERTEVILWLPMEQVIQRRFALTETHPRKRIKQAKLGLASISEYQANEFVARLGITDQEGYTAVAGIRSLTLQEAFAFIKSYDFSAHYFMAEKELLGFPRQPMFEMPKSVLAEWWEGVNKPRLAIGTGIAAAVIAATLWIFDPLGWRPHVPEEPLTEIAQPSLRDGERPRTRIAVNFDIFEHRLKRPGDIPPSESFPSSIPATPSREITIGQPMVANPDDGNAPRDEASPIKITELAHAGYGTPERVAPWNEPDKSPDVGIYDIFLTVDMPLPPGPGESAVVMRQPRLLSANNPPRQHDDNRVISFVLRQPGAAPLILLEPSVATEHEGRPDPTPPRRNIEALNVEVATRIVTDDNAVLAIIPARPDRVPPRRGRLADGREPADDTADLAVPANEEPAPAAVEVSSIFELQEPDATSDSLPATGVPDELIVEALGQTAEELGLEVINTEDGARIVVLDGRPSRAPPRRIVPPPPEDLSEANRLRPKRRSVEFVEEAVPEETTLSSGAVPFAERPKSRPASFATATAAASAPRPTPPAENPSTVNVPTSASVSRAATINNAIALRQTSLIGVYGTSANRRAIIRTSNGRYIELTVGKSFSGWRVIAIGENTITLQKDGKTEILKVPG